MNPEDRLIYDFYQSIGHELFIHMSERAELATVMKEIVRKYNRYLSQLRSSDEYITLLISKLDERNDTDPRYSDEKKRFVTTAELVEIGPLPFRICSSTSLTTAKIASVSTAVWC